MENQRLSGEAGETIEKNWERLLLSIEKTDMNI